MNYLELNDNNLGEVIDQAVLTLKKGGIIIAPFDTVYGFLADAKNDDAINKIYGLKGRDFNKPLGIVVPHPSAVAKYVDLTTNASDYIDQHAPGRYTFILRVNDPSFISLHCQKNGTVALRIPDSELILGISGQFGLPLAQTSANLAGQGNAADYEELKSQFSAGQLSQVDLIIDGGKITNSAPSKIFNLTGTTPMEIERK